MVLKNSVSSLLMRSVYVLQVDRDSFKLYNKDNMLLDILEKF